MRYKNIGFVLALVLTIIPLHESTAASIDDLLGRTHLEVMPSLMYGLEYSDNIDWDPSGKDRISDWCNRYLPRLEVNAISPRLSLKAEAELDIREYINEKDFNSVDQNYALALGYIPNERLEYSLGGGYHVNVNTNRFEDGLDPIDPFYVNRDKEKTWDLFGGFSYTFTPRSTISLTGTFSQYDTGATNESNFYGLIALYTYNLGPRTTLLVNTSYFYYDFSGNGDPNSDDFDWWYSNYNYTMDNYNIMVGVEHDFLSGYMLTTQVGYRYTESDSTEHTTGGPVKTSGNGSGWTAVLEIEKSWNDFTVILEGHQDATVSPYGATYQATTLQLRNIYRINQRTDANLILRWYKAYADSSDDEFVGPSRDSHQYSIHTYMTHKLYRWLDVSVGHQLRLYEDKRGSERSYHENRVYINFIFTPLRTLVLR